MIKRENVKKELNAKLIWKGGVCSEIKMRHHVIVIDSGKEEGGNDFGPAPTEIFLAALGACLMTNISRIGQKMRLGLKSVNMDITGTKEYNEHPASFVTLNIIVSIKADEEDREKLERLIQLAEENCTVSNTLKNAVVPHVKLQIKE
jgi:putative redox protein